MSYQLIDAVVTLSNSCAWPLIALFAMLILWKLSKPIKNKVRAVSFKGMFLNGLRHEKLIFSDKYYKVFLVTEACFDDAPFSFYSLELPSGEVLEFDFAEDIADYLEGKYDQI